MKKPSNVINPNGCNAVRGSKGSYRLAKTTHDDCFVKMIIFELFKSQTILKTARISV